MKKQLLNLSFVAIALGLYVTTAFSTPVDPVRVADVPHAGTMTMDGDDAEADYTDLMNTTVFNPTGSTGADADFQSDIKLSWDADYLYLYAVQNDDVEEDYTWTLSSPWMFDNVEVFLQLDTNTVTTSYDTHTIQLRICRGLDSVETAGRAARTDYIYFVDNTATGWVTETAIPWTAVLATADDPSLILDYVDMEIGFDFSGADSDDTDGDLTVGNRDCQTGWDADEPDTPEDRTEDNAWNNTSVFGRIVLQPVALLTPSLDQINLYPNPTTGVLNLDVNGMVDVYNVAGTLVKSVESVNYSINVSDLNEGIYFIRTENGMAKFIKK